MIICVEETIAVRSWKGQLCLLYGQVKCKAPEPIVNFLQQASVECHGELESALLVAV